MIIKSSIILIQLRLSQIIFVIIFQIITTIGKRFSAARNPRQNFASQQSHIYILILQILIFNSNIGSIK